MPRGSEGEKVKLWRSRLRRRALFAGTVEEFCRTEGVSVPAFYQWRKKLARGGRPSKQPARFRPLVVTPSVSVRPGARPAAVAARAPAALSVRLPGGAQLEVPGEHLEAVRVVVAELVRAGQGLVVGVEPC